MSLGARGCVKSGFLELAGVRGTRGVLMFCWLVSLVSGLLMWGILAVILRRPVDDLHPHGGFGVAAWLFVLTLFASFFLTVYCYRSLGELLWRSAFLLGAGSSAVVAPPAAVHPEAGPVMPSGGRSAVRVIGVLVVAAFAVVLVALVLL